MMELVPPRRLYLAMLLAALALPGCGMASSAPQVRPIVVAEAQGQCPLTSAPGASAGWPCERTRAGNGVTAVFPTLSHSWGISYPFNCGPHAGGFYAVVGLPSMDGQLQDTGFYRSGRRGRGYVMETGRGTQALAAIPAIW